MLRVSRFLLNSDIRLLIFRFQVLSPGSADLKSFPLKDRSYPGWLIALDFNGSSFHRSSTAAAHSNFFSDDLDKGEGQMSCELVDNNDSLSAAMSRFAAQHDSAGLPERYGGLVKEVG